MVRQNVWFLLMQVFRSKGTFLFQLLALSWTKIVPASHIKLGRPIHRKPVVLEEIKQNFAKDLRQKHVPIVSFITKFVTRTEGRVPLTCSWILDLEYSSSGTSLSASPPFS